MSPSRYQTKIGQYDKEQWEESVEQRILNGIVQMPLKETRLKTELIDVDLVRGSSFPKLKPKQSLLTVLRLAVLRLLFLPIYARWWAQQTSRKIFACFLVLYLLKMIKWALFSYNLHHQGSDGPSTSATVSTQCVCVGNNYNYLRRRLIPFPLPLYIVSAIHQRLLDRAADHSGIELCAQRDPFADRGHHFHHLRVSEEADPEQSLAGADQCQGQGSQETPH